MQASDRLSLWRDLLREAGPEAVAEVGVWRGDFAAAILDACPTIQRYYMIDPWRPLERWAKPLNVSTAEFEESLACALRVTEAHAEKRVVLRGTTKEQVGEIPDESLDFIYIDGDHTLRGITIDLLLMWPKLKQAGILGGDDFTVTPWQHAEQFEPTLVSPFAVYFAEAVDAPLRALAHSQFLIEKRSGFVFEDTLDPHPLELREVVRPPSGHLE